MPDTLPGEAANDRTPAVVIEATYKDPRTGALYVHTDLVAAQPAWADEEHIGPAKADERFGDIDSWAAYVQRYASPTSPPFLAWNSQGLRAVLDYHGERGGGNRCQWLASMPFEKSPEWCHWRDLVGSSPWAHKKAVERLEDLSEDITDPPAGDLMNLLRNLRSTVNATAQTELLPDGTTRIGFTQDKAVKGISDVALPPEFTIAIPVLNGRDKRYKLAVRVRANVDDQAHLALRFSIPQAERALEMVYAELVAEAKALLGDGFSLLRAAG